VFGVVAGPERAGLCLPPLYPAPVRRSRAAVSGSCGPAAARLLCGWGRSGTQTAGAPVSLEFGDFHLASGVAHGETWTWAAVR